MLGSTNQFFFEQNGNLVRGLRFTGQPDLSLPSVTLVKRVSADLAGRLAALLLLLLLSPVIVACALLVKATSKGSALYAQKRVGYRGKVFRIYKFRTMRRDAEAALGPVLSSANDPRVTPVGKLLRNLHLDELPQLVNIILGDMAFIGPRPERPEFVAQFSARIAGYENRAAVKPGITGLAQVCRGYDASAEEKLQFDLVYVKHRSSLRLNSFIVYNTIKKILFIRYNQ
jgi:lipopolysaccharide/colanic/teichoic acid biosynthesis glycosyltransferase